MKNQGKWLAKILLFWVGMGPAFGAIKVGLVLDKGGKDDKSFNAAAYKGAKEAEAKLGISLKVVESSDDTALEPSLKTFAQHNYPLVIGIGFIQQGPIEKVAKQFPKTHFVLVDSVVDLPNVRSILFKEHEGCFLVGAIAALTSKSGTVGFVGGMDIPLIRKFEMAYKAGAVHVAPKITVVSNFVGSSTDAWRNPTKGKELALAQFNKKADVIFAAAGSSGLGVFDAAEELKKFVIGVDSNQNWIKPGRVLTSMVKKVDRAVFEAIEAENKGSFQSGKLELGIRENMIEFAVDENNRSVLSPEIEKRANALRDEILKGKIQVPDYYVVSKQKKS